MIRLQKKQPVSLNHTLLIDCALPLGSDRKSSDTQSRVQALLELGVRRVVFALEPVSVTDASDLSAVASLAKQWSKSMAVEMVQSYWLDEALEAFVMNHPLTTYQDKYVLLAVRHWDAVRKLKGPLFEIRARGYEPVILHRDPKQYVSVNTRTAGYLKDLGCLLQLNVLTLAGVYGPQVRSNAEMLVKKKQVDVLTTGVRTATDVELLRVLQLAPSVASAFQEVVAQHSKYVGLA